MTIAQGMQLAAAHHSAGRFAQAEEVYRMILRQMPDNAHAMNYLGLVLIARGQKPQGLALLRKSVYADPGVAHFYANLSGALLECGEAPAAEGAAREAIWREPQDAQSYLNLGLALWKQSKSDDAIAQMRQAIALTPNRPDARSHLGLFLVGVGRPGEAVPELTLAAQLDSSALNHANLASALLAAGHMQSAVDAYRRAVALAPNDPELHLSLGLALSALGRAQEAQAALRRAIELRPNDVEAHAKLGSLLKEAGQLDDAVDHLNRALALRPDYPWALHQLGTTYGGLGQLEKAVQAFRKAISLKPHDLDADCNLVYDLYFTPGFDSATILREYQRWNRQHAAPLAEEIRPHANDREPDRRLRIGYVSPDFREHVLSFYHVPLLTNHDHAHFEIFCYSDVRRPTAVTERLRGCADTWRDVAGMSDPQLAERIRDDGIDILVDLTMHMANGRPLLFARTPAPIQVAWSYPGTTGNQAIDYRLTDPYLDPPGKFDADYTEESIRLPHTFFIYDPLVAAPDVNEPPALRNGHVTFGCLNNFMKVNDGVLDLWARVLAGVARSQFLLLAPEGSARQRVLERFTAAGVSADRVEFIGRQSRSKYLETFHRIDISLDTVPYNGHTTSLDSLWMGVPVVTLIGQTVVGRAGWCLCCNLDLRDLAASTEDQFQTIATHLANDLPKLAAMRTMLRPRMQASPLMDGRKFAGGVEAAYRTMWRRWCSVP